VTNSATQTWLSRLAIEGLVIVVSILMAFGIEAWWASAQDREREVAYLEQLESDLEGTLRNNARFSALAEVSEAATAKLFRSYYEASPLDPDSLEAWWSELGGWVVQPRLGTVQALVATGDLELIRDDSLRVAISSYLTTMIAFDGFEARGSEVAQERREELTRFVDPVALQIGSLSMAQRDSIVRGDVWSPFPIGQLRDLQDVDMTTVVRNEEVHRLLGLINENELGKRRFRNLMRSQSENLLAQVRRARVRSDSGAR
jgi:hypothetical protein